MCTGTTALLLGDAEFLSYMNPGDEGYQELYTKYLAKLALNNLWAAEDGLLEQSAGTNEYGMPDVGCRITDLKFENAAAGFSFAQVSLGKGGTWTEKVETSILWTGDDIERDEKIKWLQKAEEEKEQAVLNLFRTLTKDAGIAALGIYAPELAVLVSGLSMVMDGKAGLVTGLPSVVNAESSPQKLGVTEANTIAKDVLNGIASIGNAEKGLNQANYKDFLDWFGMGGDYRITNNDGAMSGDGITISFTGVYDPDTLRAKRIWEEKGMDAWIEWGDEKLNKKEVMERINSSDCTYEVKTMCDKLLYGGSTLFNEGMDMETFEESIDAICRQGELNKNTPELQFRSFVLHIGSGE